MRVMIRVLVGLTLVLASTHGMLTPRGMGETCGAECKCMKALRPDPNVASQNIMECAWASTPKEEFMNMAARAMDMFEANKGGSEAEFGSPSPGDQPNGGMASNPIINMLTLLTAKNGGAQLPDILASDKGTLDIPEILSKLGGSNGDNPEGTPQLPEILAMLTAANGGQLPFPPPPPDMLMDMLEGIGMSEKNMSICLYEKFKERNISAPLMEALEKGDITEEMKRDLEKCKKNATTVPEFMGCMIRVCRGPSDEAPMDFIMARQIMNIGHMITALDFKIHQMQMDIRDMKLMMMMMMNQGPKPTGDDLPFTSSLPEPEPKPEAEPEPETSPEEPDVMTAGESEIEVVL